MSGVAVVSGRAPLGRRLGLAVAYGETRDDPAAVACLIRREGALGADPLKATIARCRDEMFQRVGVGTRER